MPRVGFEPTIPVFERAKTVHVSDRVATVIDNVNYLSIYLSIYGSTALCWALAALSVS
jgi:hypothetical protein